jgi:hydroxymethylpyrimidine pyrophosphatase-like HAD family hydrolase
VIFASDLDRTLIYSKNSMGDGITEDDLVPVELYEGNYISFMTKQAVSILSELTKLSTFVPVTTRTVEQYQRVFYLNNVFKPKYAITSNGGNILIDSSPDEEWANLMQSALRISVNHLEVKAMYEAISSPDWALRGRLCDGLFYTMIIDREKMPTAIIEEFTDQLLRLDWTVSIQGRKLYLVPACINKGAALRYLKERVGATFICASGDSLLDESLLTVADFSISPSHGELFNTYQDAGNYQFTTSSGIRASEELMMRIKETIDLQSRADK